jgi:dTDP-glucose 4,6-dehydratase
VSPTRDLNYVPDSVAGFIAALNSYLGLGEVINFGSNFEASVGDTLLLIADIMGARIELETDAQRLRPQRSEVERLWADNSKAKRLLGWAPAYGGLEGLRRGLSETIAWFVDERNLRLYRPDEYSV